MNDFAPGAAPPRGPQFDNRRVLAGLIDVLIVGLVAFVIGVAAGMAGTESGQWSPALSAVVLGWGLFYYFALESGAGQTVGKRLLGLRVTMADGTPADMRAIAIRTVLRVIDGIFLYLVGLIVMLVSGERRQRLGDMAGGTIITSADYKRSAAPAASAPAPTPAVVLPSAPEAPTAALIPEPPAPVVEPAPVAIEPPAPEIEPAPAVEPAPVAFEPPAPSVESASAVESAPVAFEPAPAVEPAPTVETASTVEPDPVAFEPPAPSVEPAPAVEPAPSVEPAPAFFEASAPSEPPAIEVPAAQAPSAPELKPFQPFSTPAPENGVGPSRAGRPGRCGGAGGDDRVRTGGGTAAGDDRAGSCG